MSLTVYGSLTSPFVRAVRLALAEKAAEYAFAEVLLPDTKSPEHMARNPFGRIPVIQHNDFVLYETHAILRYLDAVLPGPSLIPTAPEAAARMTQVIGIVDSDVLPRITIGLCVPRLVSARHGKRVDETAIAATLPKAETCLQALDAILGAQPWFTGDTVSLADLAAAPHFDYLALTPEGVTLLQRLPNLGSWLLRMRQRPSMVATAAPW